jgi:EmrB/QacA subfamily drug resistance transporter
MASTTDQSTAAPVRHAWLVLAMVISTAVLTGIGLSIMSVAFPEIRKAFPDATPSQLSWINNLFTIVSAATLVPCGVLADRFGRKRMMLTGIAIFTAGSFIGALAPSPGWIMVGRTVQALGSSAYTPAGAALLIAAFPPEKLATAIGVWSITGGVSSALGPSVGGFVIDRGGWQWAFWMNIPIGLLVLLIGPRVLAETATDRTKRMPDLLGVALIMAGSSAITFGVVQRKTQPGWGWLGGRTWLCFVVGAAILGWFILRCKRHENPLLQLDLFRIPNVRVGVAGTFVVATSWFALNWAVVQHTINVWHWTVFKAGVSTAPISLFSGITGVLSGRVAHRYGHRRFILVGSVGMIAVAMFFWFAMGDEPALWSVVVPGSTALGLASGLVFPSYIATTLLDVPVERHAVGSSINFMIQRMGTTFGTALAITFIAADIGTHGLHQTLVVTMLGCAICFALAFTVRRSATLQGS